MRSCLNHRGHSPRKGQSFPLSGLQPCFPAVSPMRRYLLPADTPSILFISQAEHLSSLPQTSSSSSQAGANLGKNKTPFHCSANGVGLRARLRVRVGIPALLLSNWATSTSLCLAVRVQRLNTAPQEQQRPPHRAKALSSSRKLGQKQ